MTETTPLNFSAIHKGFSETELGATLASRVRWGKYQPEDVSNERWQELLGADVNNLDHLMLTYGLSLVMIKHLRVDKPGFLNEHEEKVLLVTALIHDWAEAIVGDINFSDKTDKDEAEEMSHLYNILHQSYGRDTTGMMNLMAEALEVIRSKQSKLGMVFNTIEHVGYMRTGLRAAGHLKKGTAPDCDSAFKWLTVDALSNNPELLIGRSEEYPPVRTYLLNQAPQILDAYLLTADERIFENYSAERQAVKLGEYKSGKAALISWLPTQSLVDLSVQFTK